MSKQAINEYVRLADALGHQGAPSLAEAGNLPMVRKRQNVPSAERFKTFAAMATTSLSNRLQLTLEKGHSGEGFPYLFQLVSASS